MGCPLSPEKELLEAEFGASADTVFWIAMDRMFDHTATAAVAQQLLRLALATKPSAAKRDAIVAGGGGDIPGMTMSHHITNPTIVRDAAALMHRMLAAPGAARRLDGEAARCLATALRYLFATDRDAPEAAAAGEPEAADVAFALMRTLTRLLEGGSVALWGRLTEGINYVQLVTGMRKHMANVSAAAAACRLLAAIAEPRMGSPARVSQLGLAGAVPLVIDIMEAHEADAQVVAAAASAFARLAKDASLRPQMAEPRPVLLLWRLLQRHVHSVEVMAGVLGECVAAIMPEESSRAVLMDDGAAAGTLRCVVETARLHPASVPVTCSALVAVKWLCRSYDDYSAAHEAGAFTLAVDRARELGAEQTVAFASPSLISIGVLWPRACEQLQVYGAPAAMVDLVQRYSASSDTIRPACQSLFRLFGMRDAPEAVKPALAAAVPVLVAALREHKEDSDIAVSGCYILANAARAMPDVLLGAAPVPVLRDVMRQHLGQEHVVCGALDALMVAAETPSARGAGAVARAKLLPDVAAALEKHGRHSGVAQSAYRVIRALHGWQAAGGARADEFNLHVPAVLTAVARSTRHATLDSMTICVACLIMTELARVEAYRPHFAQGGVIPMLLGILRRYADGDDTVEASIITASAVLCKVTSAPECAALLRSLSSVHAATIAAVQVRVAHADTEAKREIKDSMLHLSWVLAQLAGHHKPRAGGSGCAA